MTLCNIINAQTINGIWNGQLNVETQKLSLILHIPKNNNDKIILDSPDQSVYGIKADSSFFDSTSIYLTVKKLGLILSGNYNTTNNDSIYCTFQQMGFQTDIIFGRGEQKNIKNKEIRIQDPKDFPYKQEEISIYNDKTGVTLSGTLTIPYNIENANKIAVLISGSGLQDRNEEVFNHRPFLVLSDYLTRHNIAVIRYDDRGYAKSTGNAKSATTYDYSLDAESVVKYIKSRKDLQRMLIGLIGHSEGGSIASMVAARNNNVDFIVLLAGPGVRGDKLILRQQQDLSHSSSTNNLPKLKDRQNKEKLKWANKITKCTKTANKKIISTITNNKLSNDKKYALSNKIWDKYYTVPMMKNGMDTATINQIKDSELQTYMIPWMQYFLKLNPDDYLKHVTIPVLALNGSNDLQVNADINLNAINKSLKKAKNNQYKIMKIDSVNHLFQKCVFGSPNLYQKNKETFNEDVMRTITDWIQDL